MSSGPSPPCGGVLPVPRRPPHAAAMGAPGAGAGSKEHTNVRAGAKSGRTQRGVKGKMPLHVCATRDCQRRTSARAACRVLCSALVASWRRAGAAEGEQGRVGDVSHHTRLLEMAAGGEAPLSVHTCSILVLWAPCGCAVHPKFTVAPEPCPGMTAALRAGCLLPVGCRDGCEHVRVPEHPGQGIAFHEALSAPSLIISRCSAKFLPANP